MVFLIQRAQNKELMAIQLKLNELIATIHGASNRLINIEKLTEEEGISLHQQYAALAHQAKEDGKTIDSLSIENAEHNPLQKNLEATEGNPVAVPGTDSAFPPDRDYNRPLRPLPF